MVNSFVNVALFASFWEIFNAVLAWTLITLFALEMLLFEHEAQLALVVLRKLHKFVTLIEILVGQS